MERSPFVLKFRKALLCIFYIVLMTLLLFYILVLCLIQGPLILFFLHLFYCFVFTCVIYRKISFSLVLSGLLHPMLQCILIIQKKFVLFSLARISI